MVAMIESMQTRDSLRMYNSLVEKCFSTCVQSFRRKTLEKDEERVRSRVYLSELPLAEVDTLGCPPTPPPVKLHVEAPPTPEATAKIRAACT